MTAPAPCRAGAPPSTREGPSITASPRQISSASRHQHQTGARQISARYWCAFPPETLMDPRHAEVRGRAAPRGIARHYDGDHFEIYHRPLVDSLLADQTAFLREYLHVEDT
ncbi:hypothetical protein I551_5893 [Mycobacterium ulcerans str. Harvey]|uniref:Uncharacterized protein n=1 Tax=Mycobacterium ulcerans str. Harvey TaxID=1299332 RepID=A0ABP3A9W2_MYCUL|nr:hypothetical protein I551_5893 [Mycobacterium ulcerans str. Harvey]